MNKNGFTPILIVLILAAVLAVGGYFVWFNYSNNQTKPIPSPNQVACTQEAKLCPDGSYVGRAGSKCEFTPCPTPKESTTSADMTNWKTYKSTKYDYSIRYPNNWSLCNVDKEDIIFINHVQVDCSSTGLNDVSIFITPKSDESAQYDLKHSDKSKLFNTTLAGINAVKSQETGNTYIFRGNYLYSINGDLRFKDNPNTINQILSTFKFTQ